MAVMGIAQNSINFGGISSAAYDLYIGGEGVWNAPARAVEVVEIPGRNGSIAIDQGHYENVTVVYTIINNEASLADFRTKIDAFRNAICSQKGYQRLADSFHPDEYRLAMFVDGMEVKPINYTAAAEFEIKFNCKPQRFLTSGESEVTVTTGDELYNPTQYEAGPLIEAVGYGTIDLNGKEIEIDNAVMGELTLANSGKNLNHISRTVNANYFNVGDSITVKGSTFYGSLNLGSSYSVNSITNVTNGTAVQESGFSRKIMFEIPLSDWTVTAGTSATDSVTFSFTLSYWSGFQTYTDNISIVAKRTYDGDDYFNFEYYTLTYSTPPISTYSAVAVCEGITVNSSVSILGNPTYIDCDLGECYKIVSGTVVDLNAYIDLGSDLPVLKPGINEITYDNTITSLKVKPGWWQL